MKKVMLFILLLPLTALADHHRGHAVANLEAAQGRLTTAIDRLDDYAAAATFTAFQAARASTARVYLNAALTNATTSIALLNDPATDLDTVRRLINQPNRDFPLSALGRMRTTDFLLGDLFPPNPNDLDTWMQFRRAVGQSWHELDMAAWHITDAIREEIYSDQEFICSGPNNHCE